MANEQNLVKGDEIHKFTPEEHRKGAQRSAEVRRAKRDLRKALESLLESNVSVKDKATGNTVTMAGTEAICTKLFEQAMKGNVKAFKTIRETVGQDPVQKIAVSEVSPEVIDEVESAVLEDE